jgi:tetraacyldisaccharide 4'-kinase
VPLERWFNKRWYEDRATLAFLQPLAGLYGSLVGARRSAYAAGWLRSGRAGKPVVVVGNLTVGGTGKTPLTIWLARELSELGLSVGIVSRGYGSTTDADPRTVGAGSAWSEVGDEPVIIARRTGCPTVVSTDRLAAARSLAGGVDVILADDGLQHLRLARDCEIVVIDGVRGFGNGRLLPAGPLREPLAGLARADVLVVNGPPRHPSLQSLPQRAMVMSVRPLHAVRIDARAPPQALADFSGQHVHAVAGTGNPGRFFHELRAHGIKLTEHPFPDHHPLSVADLAFGDRLSVLMTEKDAVKCATRADARLWYVPVAAEFTPEDARELLERVLGKIRATTLREVD